MKKSAKETVDILSSFVNVLGNDQERNKEFAQAFMCEHRTLQQSMLKMIFVLLQEIARAAEEEPSRYTDARNEDGYNNVKELMKDKGSFYFPLI